MIVIGLGSGRSGTASLAHLLNSQNQAKCFHELNPSCMKFSGTVQPALNTIAEFQRILDGGPTDRLTVDLSREVILEPYEDLCRRESVALLGDIAMYYLQYVEDILLLNPNVSFVCLKRDKEATVRSWLRKTTIKRWPSLWIRDKLYSLISRTPYFTEYNFWQENLPEHVDKDDIWDKCFPKFEAPSKYDAVCQYWDYYYEAAEVLAAAHPAAFKIFSIDCLNNSEGQKQVLNHCRLPEEKHIYTSAHLHALP